MWSNGRVTKWEEKVSAGGVGVGGGCSLAAQIVTHLWTLELV